MEKGHELSRAELKIFQLKLWLEPARLGLITTIWDWDLNLGRKELGIRVSIVRASKHARCCVRPSSPYLVKKAAQPS